MDPEDGMPRAASPSQKDEDMRSHSEEASGSAQVTASAQGVAVTRARRGSGETSPAA